MASKKSSTSKIDPEQRELIEKAQSRARQKRRLYQHFILFLIGSVVLILLNVFFEIGREIKPLGLDWFVWVIILWGIIFFLHVFNVFVTNKFLGKDWEDRQIERLVEKQRKRIDELQEKVERDHPIKQPKEPASQTNKRIDPESPLNT